VLRDVDLRVEPGRIVALLGSSGCGKTTLLRAVAGLERLDAGEVRVGDRLLSAAARDEHVPPEKRRVGMVFQDWALFPHLTVAQNVGYGLPRAERRGPRVAAALHMVGLDGLGGRQPATMSGGQQQRVALARRPSPASCSWTNRSPTSTRRSGCKSAPRCTSCSPTSASPRSS
jgi:iron(III) transport system ATP-binding protein